MCECARCKKTYEEYELLWVEQPSENCPQVIWTGRGKDPYKEKKVEVICKECLEKEKRADR